MTDIETVTLVAGWMRFQRFSPITCIKQLVLKLVIFQKTRRGTCRRNVPLSLYEILFATRATTNQNNQQKTNYVTSRTTCTSDNVTNHPLGNQH